MLLDTYLLVRSTDSVFGWLILLLLALGWYVACRCPKGLQASTSGHIQTLTELMDECSDGDRLFWGDEGATNNSEFWCIGTSVMPALFDLSTSTHNTKFEIE